MRVKAVLNRGGGTLRTMDLDAFTARARDIFADAGHELDCVVVDGDGVADALRRAATSDGTDALLAGGGDGTISSAAATAFETGVPLGILPAGTMNLFARALRMPLDLDAALHAIAHGQVRHIDIATANGRPFVHQFGVGIHARLVRIRSHMVYGSRWGKMLASLRAIGAAAVDPPRFEVEVYGGGATSRRTVSGIAVSNNPLDNAPVPVAKSLDSGLLGVYLASSVTTHELFNLGIDVLTGRWRDNAMVSEVETPQLTLHFPKRRRGHHAVIDGELIALDPSVHLKIHHEALKVILPSAETENNGK